MQDMGEMVAACDTMHGSSAMQRMMERMPAELRERCEAMHNEMLEMMQDMAEMMGGSG